MKWIASAAFGMEGLTGRDLKRLGAEDVRVLNVGGAEFSGTLESAMKANLWLRCADHISLVVGEFPARSFEELFEGIRRIEWADYLARDSAFPVRARCVKSVLMSQTDTQKIVKKAVVEKLKGAYGVSWFEETGATVQIDVSIRGDVATVSLDASGEPLSRRGYRTWNGEAPLRETLAAALILTSGWHPWQPLYDPCCGTGTLLIEAAFIALNRAPGLRRPFAMEKWPFADVSALERVRREAQSRSDEGQQREIRIAGSDIDPEAIELARRHIRQAGLGGRIEVEVMDMRDVVLKGEPGAIVANPPYGERIGDRRVAHVVARQLGELSRRCPGWNVYAFSADMGFEREFGRRADRRRRFYNGRIECEYHMFENGTPAQNGGAHTRGGRK
ncbi:MAG: class I SAM-dependent RNA methyltransferase [Eubacteriales bacterium]|nr:class I SAM-dependent RNA methyltransferase [Clostridiales bacterium]MDY2768311.1 class I SAM-dependent RNA methyltransferase [Eubacteriales bacterium]